MKSSEIISILTDIESRYPVAEWRLKRVRVWPLYRVRLYSMLVMAELQGTHVAGAAKRNHLVTALATVGKILRAAVLDFSRNRWPTRADAVFMSDGVSFARLGDVYYDRICDPIIDRFTREGKSTLLLTPGTRPIIPRRTASFLIQPFIDLAKILGSALNRIRPLQQSDIELPGFESLLNELKPRFQADTVPTRAWLFASFARVEALAEFFGALLRRVRPSVAFVNTYYSAENMAFVLACRRCHVPVIDLQHGSQGIHHMAYGRWSNVPMNGYDLLPSEFWCWSKAEQDAIESWRQPSLRTHHAKVVGNPWLKMWLDADEASVVAELDKAKRLQIEAGGTAQVLITLNWGLSEHEDVKIFQAMALCPQTFRWWVRLHQSDPRPRALVRRLLDREGVKHADIDNATDLPLFAILKFATLHVTHSSTVAIEASVFNVRSVITSEYGAEQFAALVQSKIAVVALDPAGIAAAIRELAAFSESRSASLYSVAEHGSLASGALGSPSAKS